MFKSLHFKSFLLSMLVMFIGGVNSAWADTEKAFALSGTDATAVESVSDVPVTITFSQGTNTNNAPKWYDNGSALRFYSGNKITIESSGAKITKVVLTNTESQLVGGNSGANYPNTGTYSVDNKVETWTATTPVSSLEISITNKPRLTNISVFLEDSSSPLDFITVDGAETVFHVGDEFTHAQAVVTATYEDESTADVTANATFSTPNMTTVGEKEVEVSYTEGEVTKTDTYTINVLAPATLDRIELSGSYPTEFTQGDEFSHEGLMVTACYDDDTSEDVTADATFSEPDMTTAGEQTVTVTYEGKTEEYTITVNEYVQPTEVTVNMNYQWLGSGNGSNLSSNQLPVVKNQDNVTITITDGTSTRPRGDADYIRVYKGSTIKFEAPTGYNIKEIVFTTGGNNTWNAPIVDEVAMTGKTWEGLDTEVTFSLNGSCFIASAKVTLEAITPKVLSSITLSGEYPTTFHVGDEFSHEGMTVTANYDDDSTKDVTEDATFSAPDMTIVGEQTVTVSYGGQSTSYNITITEAPTLTATFSVNGTISTEDFKEGAAITFPSVTAPTGYTFMGWTGTAISTTQETAPADLTSSATMGNADVTYYAVFAVGTGGAPSLTKMVSGDTFTDGDKVVIVADVDETTSYGLYQQTISNSYVMNFVFDNSVTTIAADDKNYLTVSSGSDGKWKLGDDTNGYLYSSGSNNLAVSTESATEWTLEDNEDGTFSLLGARYLSCRTDLPTENANRWRMAGSSPAGVYKLAIYKFVDGNTSYSDYCTTIPTTVAITITAAGAASFSSKYALDFSNVEGLKAYKATSKSDSYVHLDEVKQVPAGAGVIVKGAEGTYNVPVVTGDVAELEGNLLQGTATKAYTVGDDYGKVFKYVKRTSDDVVGFQKAKADWTCQIGHAYLMFSETPAREFIGIFGEDISTGIEAIDNSQLTMDNDAPAYNLAGQKVGKGYKGIVVKNGKKYVK